MGSGSVGTDSNPSIRFIFSRRFLEGKVPDCKNDLPFFSKDSFLPSLFCGRPTLCLVRRLAGEKFRKTLKGDPNDVLPNCEINLSD